MKTIDSQITNASDMASRITYSGSGVSLAAAIGGVDWVAWLGAVVAIVGLFVNVYFKIREDRRNAEAHELKKQRLKCGKCDE